LNKNKIFLLKYLQGIDISIKFVLSNWKKLVSSLIKTQCWVVKFLADTPPCPGGGDHRKPEAG
jgi:hypothetical protein